ncbi:MAG TPA: DUF6111 family protein [Alphaproteobacteria bacterium]
MRTLLTRILPLLLPVLVYLGWWYLARRRALARGETGPALSEAPWTWLFVAGFALLVMTLVVLGLTWGEEPGGVYVPPRYEGGKIVPGHIER